MNVLIKHLSSWLAAVLLAVWLTALIVSNMDSISSSRRDWLAESSPSSVVWFKRSTSLCRAGPTRWQSHFMMLLHQYNAFMMSLFTLNVVLKATDILLKHCTLGEAVVSGQAHFLQVVWQMCDLANQEKGKILAFIFSLCMIYFRGIVH